MKKKVVSVFQIGSLLIVASALALVVHTGQQIPGKDMSGALVIDVRSQAEFSRNRISGAINIPHYDVIARLSEISHHKNGSITLYCDHGVRADMAADILRERGFQNVRAAGFSELIGDQR